MRRADDEPASVRRRIEVYEQQTAPVVAWYRSHGLAVTTVNALGALEDVAARTRTAIAA